MTTKHLLGTIFFVAGISTAYLLSGQNPHIAPAYLYPDPVLTPGLVATSNFTELTAKYNGQTYSQANRKTTEAMKKQVCLNYKSPCKDVEIDHYCPLALGCADNIKNLWPQPATNLWNGVNFGFHEKDKLETYLVNQMKSGKISPADAQSCILRDWIACYMKYFNKKVLGAVSVDGDENQ